MPNMSQNNPAPKKHTVRAILARLFPRKFRPSMSHHDPKPQKQVIRATLAAENAHSCAFRAQYVSQSGTDVPPLHDFATAHGIDENTMIYGADTLFALGSGMKLLINFALYRMIEVVGVCTDDTVRLKLKDAWDKPAYEL
jgi:hypothetical protein